MRMELYGGPIRVRRLLFLLLIVSAVVAAAVAFLPLGLFRLAALAVLALPFAAVLFDRPKWILYILLIILFSNLDIFAPFHIFRLTIVFLLASFAFSLACGRKFIVHDRRFAFLLVAFLILVLQSLTVARDLDTSLWRLNLFIKVLINIAIAIQFVRNRIEFRHLFIVIAIGVLLSNLLPFVLEPPEKYANVSLMWGKGILRYEGYAFEANLFGLFQLFVIPILIFLAAAYKKPKFARPVLLIALFSALVVLILSFSRGGFVSLVFLVVGLLIIERKNRAILITDLLVMVVGAALVPAAYWERIGSLLDFGTQFSQDYNIITRWEGMKAAMIMGLKNPLLGIGLENYLYNASRYVQYNLVVHNSVLQIFAEAGVFALAVLAGMIFYNIRIIRGLMKRRDDVEAAQAGRMLLLQHIVVFIGSMFIATAYTDIFWWTLALPSIAGYAYRKNSSEVVGPAAAA